MFEVIAIPVLIFLLKFVGLLLLLFTLWMPFSMLFILVMESRGWTEMSLEDSLYKVSYHEDVFGVYKRVTILLVTVESPPSLCPRTPPSRNITPKAYPREEIQGE